MFATKNTAIHRISSKIPVKIMIRWTRTRPSCIVLFFCLVPQKNVGRKLLIGIYWKLLRSLFSPSANIMRHRMTWGWFCWILWFEFGSVFSPSPSAPKQVTPVDSATKKRNTKPILGTSRDEPNPKASHHLLNRKQLLAVLMNFEISLLGTFRTGFTGHWVDSFCLVCLLQIMPVKLRNSNVVM